MHASTATRGLPLFLVLALLAGDTAAQAWVQEPGGIYLKLSGSYLFTREQFNHTGDREDIFSEKLSRTDTWFRDVSIMGYVEYGLTENYTIVASVPVKILTSRETKTVLPLVARITRENGDLGDLWLSVRRQVLRMPFAVAVQAGVKVPLGYDQRPENNGPGLGTSERDGEINLILGKSLYPWPAYVAAGVGYRRRDGGTFHDEILFNVEGGYTAGPLFLKLRFDGLKNTEDPPDLSQVVSNANVGDQDIYKLSPTVSYRIRGGISVTAEAFHTLAGKDTVTGTAYVVGVIFGR